MQSDHGLSARQRESDVVAGRHPLGLKRAGHGAGPLVQLGVRGLGAVSGAERDAVAVDAGGAGDPGFHQRV
jgi:hypothetical protein